MRCQCGGTSSVIDSRETLGGITRRRKCDACALRWSTRECVAERVGVVGAAVLRNPQDAALVAEVDVLRRRVKELEAHLSWAQAEVARKPALVRTRMTRAEALVKARQARSQKQSGAALAVLARRKALGAIEDRRIERQLMEGY